MLLSGRIASMANSVITRNLYWYDCASEFFQHPPPSYSNVQPYILKTILSHLFIVSSDNYLLVRLCARHQVEVAGTFRNSTDDWTIKGNRALTRDTQQFSLFFREVKLNLRSPAPFSWAWLFSRLLMAMPSALSLLPLSSLLLSEVWLSLAKYMMIGCLPLSGGWDCRADSVLLGSAGTNQPAGPGNL